MEIVNIKKITMYVCYKFFTSLLTLINSKGSPLAQGGRTTSPSTSLFCLTPTHKHNMYITCTQTIMLRHEQKSTDIYLNHIDWCFLENLGDRKILV